MNMNRLLLTRRICGVLNISCRTTVDLAYKVYGTTPTGADTPVIVLHGLIGSKKSWESTCKKILLTTNKTVIAVDARNHGQSPRHSSLTYRELASDVSQLISKLSLSKVNIIGYSMGGRTGMVLSLTEPEIVASLVVVDISPISTPAFLNYFFPKLFDVMKSIDFTEVNNLNQARQLAHDKIMASGVIKHAESTDFILLNIEKRSDKSFGWMCNIDTIKKDFFQVYSFPSSEMAGKTYTGPVLFIRAGNSNHLPPEDINGIRTLFPQAKFTYVPNVGHDVNVENPKALLDLVTTFLKEI